MNKFRQQGVSLLEVLVALVVCSVGILGVVGLQVTMSRAQTSATFRGEATYLAQQLIGGMWADRANLADYDSATCAGDPCKGWKAQLASRLPSGAATVGVTTASGVTTVTIEIRWTAPGEGTNRYSTATTITDS